MIARQILDGMLQGVGNNHVGKTIIAYGSLGRATGRDGYVSSGDQMVGHDDYEMFRRAAQIAAKASEYEATRSYSTGDAA